MSGAALVPIPKDQKIVTRLQTEELTNVPNRAAGSALTQCWLVVGLYGRVS